MTNLELAQDLLRQRRLALVGVSRESRDFTRGVLRELLRRGYQVEPIHPGAAGALFDGRPVAARIGDLAGPVDGALFFTPPARTAAAVEEALAAGVRRIWLHRGAGAGASSPAALEACRAAGVEPVVDLCPYMALAGAGWFHRLHAFLRQRG
jgi:predicted CoA-binding protein